ncbi:MAG TPA: peptidoglycan-binding domain-containing protein, partial [Polyangiaceae bacterium]|nr:peptidoglycan-binding domain-containing protein [Polyangiaceae bacterium]
MEGVVQGIMKYSAIVSTLALALGLGGTALAQDMAGESQQSPEMQGQQEQQPGSQQEPSAEQAQQQSGQVEVVAIEELSSEQRKELQQKLKEQGHYQGAVDGVIGPKTETALREFQEQNQLEGDGQLTQETVQALDMSIERQPVAGEEQPQQQGQQPSEQTKQQQQQQPERT